MWLETLEGFFCKIDGLSLEDGHNLLYGKKQVLNVSSFLNKLLKKKDPTKYQNLKKIWPFQIRENGSLVTNTFTDQLKQDDTLKSSQYPFMKALHYMVLQTADENVKKKTKRKRDEEDCISDQDPGESTGIPVSNVEIDCISDQGPGESTGIPNLSNVEMDSISDQGPSESTGIPNLSNVEMDCISDQGPGESTGIPNLSNVEMDCISESGDEGDEILLEEGGYLFSDMTSSTIDIGSLLMQLENEDKAITEALEKFEKMRKDSLEKLREMAVSHKSLVDDPLLYTYFEENEINDHGLSLLQYTFAMNGCKQKN